MIMQDFFKLFDLETIIFIIAVGEFVKKMSASIGIDKFMNKFWQIVIFVTPFAICFSIYRNVKVDKFVLSYFTAFWLYQAIIKRIMGFLKNNNYGIE